MILLIAALPAAGQKLADIDVFKGSVGIWTGKGKSVLGPEKKQVGVTDLWKGQLVDDGKVYIQDGKITLSEGGSFGYRWVYRYEEGQLIARYADSTNNGGICAVELSKDKKTMTLSPLNMDLEAEKRGLFSTVALKDGAYRYTAELRGADGTVNVKTEMTCRPRVEEPEKDLEK